MRYSKQIRINQLEEENQALRRENADLKRRQEIGIDALAAIARCEGVKPGWMAPNDDWKHAMANLASTRLVQIAKCALREAP